MFTPRLGSLQTAASRGPNVQSMTPVSTSPMCSSVILLQVVVSQRVVRNAVLPGHHFHAKRSTVRASIPQDPDSGSQLGQTQRFCVACSSPLHAAAATFCRYDIIITSRLWGFTTFSYQMHCRIYEVVTIAV